MRETDEYNDIIGLPHPTSKKHPRMSALDRAAQFSPFAALKGYGEALDETARLTHERIVLDEESKAAVNEKLLALKETEREHPQVRITYFRPDARKAGGEYVTAEGQLRRLDEYRRKLILTGEEIPIEEILSLEIL